MINFVSCALFKFSWSPKETSISIKIIKQIKCKTKRCCFGDRISETEFNFANAGFTFIEGKSSVNKFKNEVVFKRTINKRKT